MKNKFIIATLACLISLLALLVSCSSTPGAPATQSAAPTAAGTAPTTAAPSAASPTAAPSGQTGASTTPKLGMTKPEYGGTFTTYSATDPTNFDAGTKGQGAAAPLYGLVYQQYVTFNWLKGPAGGGPVDYLAPGYSSVEDLYGAQIAESWKMPTVNTWVLEIRQGMHWQKPNTPAGQLMNGREVTADDVVSSLQRLLTAPKAWMNVAAPADAKATKVEKTGPWEVTITLPRDDVLTAWYWIIQGGGFNALYPPEVVKKYGDVADWHNAVGTGPYMLTDYTKGSSLTFTKNPDYWQTDPAGPGKGNKLPYIDTYKELIIPDVSTQLAAFRTGKVDALPLGINKEDAQPIMKEDPQVISLPYLNINTTYGISMRTDKQNLPFKDKRVRQALMLATDFNALSQTLYGGNAVTDDWPVNKGNRALFQPVSQLPQADQDLYKYNPTKAKQLLAQAGYPNGFKTTVNTWSDPTLMDNLSVYKSMWAKVGIDLTIVPMEFGAFNAMANARSQPEMIYRMQWSGSPGVLFLGSYRGPNTFNGSYVDDPIGTQPDVEKVFAALNKDVFVNWPKEYTDYKEIKPVLLDNAYVIPTPQPYIYTMWWPWLKNYFGQMGFGFISYAWIDQNLKKSMGK